MPASDKHQFPLNWTGCLGFSKQQDTKTRPDRMNSHTCERAQAMYPGVIVQASPSQDKLRCRQDNLLQVSMLSHACLHNLSATDFTVGLHRTSPCMLQPNTLLQNMLGNPDEWKCTQGKAGRALAVCDAQSHPNLSSSMAASSVPLVESHSSDQPLSSSSSSSMAASALSVDTPYHTLSPCWVYTHRRWRDLKRASLLHHRRYLQRAVVAAWRQHSDHKQHRERQRRGAVRHRCVKFLVVGRRRRPLTICLPEQHVCSYFSGWDMIFAALPVTPYHHHPFSHRDAPVHQTLR